jgi:hypothetical protein
MTPIRQTGVRNRLISVLSDMDFDRLAPHLEMVELPRLFTLSVPDRDPEYCYFPEAGIGSVVAISGRRRVEVSIFGFDGMSSTAIVLNAGSSPYSIFMHVGGQGFRIRSEKLAHALGELHFTQLVDPLCPGRRRTDRLHGAQQCFRPHRRTVGALDSHVP